MAIKTFNPTTPSRRNMTVLNYQGLSKVKPEKSLLEKVKKTAGRNSYGRITVRHIGGGNKKKYRIIDFKRQKLDVFAEVKTLEYDPNRSANIALIQYEDGEKRYIIAPQGLKVGDKLILSDNANEMDYAFTIKGVADYSAGLTVFMDIDSMRELFDKDDDYYNVLYSDAPLDIEEGRIYSVQTKDDIYRSSDVFIRLMMPMIIMLSGVSVIIFCVVLFLMMNVMIDRAGFGISLIKIFGFRTKEIKRLYLNGNTAVIAVSSIIFIPLSKKIIDKFYPVLVANVSSGTNLTFKWYYYLLIFAAVMVIYSIINAVLVGKLKKITPAEVLKNRE